MTKAADKCNIQVPMEVIKWVFWDIAFSCDIVLLFGCFFICLFGDEYDCRLIDEGKNTDEYTRDVLNSCIAKNQITKGKTDAYKVQFFIQFLYLTPYFFSTEVVLLFGLYQTCHYSFSAWPLNSATPILEALLAFIICNEHSVLLLYLAYFECLFVTSQRAWYPLLSLHVPLSQCW